MNIGLDLQKMGNALGQAAQNVGTYSAKAAAQANSISQQAQSAQGAFNQASANQANMLNDQSISNQYGFNSAMMSAANDYNTEAWERAAEWNEYMWEKQAKYNAEQAEIQRNWQADMANTQYQRAIKDMSKAGLNPILAVTGGGIGTGVPTGATASVGGAQMSSASSQMASGGLLGANAASESNFSGQMEQMSSTLALLGAVFQGISSAEDALGDLGDVGEGLGEAIGNMFSIQEGSIADKTIKGTKGAANWIQDQVNNIADTVKSWWDGGKSNVKHINEGSYDNLVRTRNRLENDKRIQTHNAKPKG